MRSLLLALGLAPSESHSAFAEVVGIALNRKKTLPGDRFGEKFPINSDKLQAWPGGTEAWLTKALRQHGSIDAGTSVRSCAVEPLGQGAGLLSELKRLTIACA